MQNVVSLLEIEVANELSTAGVVSVPVLAGQSDGTRPDQYVSVVVTSAEHRGQAHLCLLEFRVVGPVFAAPSTLLQERMGDVYAWAVGDTSPLKWYSNNGLNIYGHSPGDLSSETKDTQRAEILQFRVGAQVVS